MAGKRRSGLANDRRAYRCVCPITQSTPVVPTTYTVTYNGNTNTSGTAPVDGSSPYTAGANVTVLGNTGTLTKTGYQFAGWNTAANGTGTNYVGGDAFTINANTTLYAQWTPVVPTTYTVTYNGNTNTSGTAPVDGSSPYTAGANVTVLGNTGTLTKTGYQFAGWNTAANGTGTNYVGGDTFTINANTTLYAQWIIGGARLVYNANSAAGGTGTAPPSSGTYYTAFSTQPVVDNTGSFTNTNGYTFGGWNTLANGTGTNYPAGSNVTMPGSGTVTLYAQWINPAITYTLTYNPGIDGTGTAPNNPNPTIYSSNETATVLGNTGPYIHIGDETKIFYGWNTAEDGSGISYPPGSTLTMTGNTNLYAQWVYENPQYLVTYDANGASGGAVPAAPTNYPGGVQVSILGQGALTRPGYTFLGWNGSPTGASSVYAPGYTFASKTATLYALWAPGSPVKSCGGGSGSTYIAYTYPYAMIIQSSDTVTIYTTCLASAIPASTNTSGPGTTYGSGTAPEGLISIASKVVITSSTITINTNTTYAVTAPNNYSKTITNGSGVTYWPSGETLTTVTFPTINPRTSNPPNYYGSTRNVTNGCGLNAFEYSSSGVNCAFGFFIQGVTLNYSNSTNTQFISSPTNAVYTSNSGVSFVTAPNTLYPYTGVTASSSAALTAITIIPSTSSEYVYPDMPNYTVQYDGNGATGGTVPIPRYMVPYTATASVTISSQGSLAKSTVPNTFSGWNTATDGLGTNYAAGATYSGGASLILYAKWT